MVVYYSVFFITLFLSYCLPAKTDKQWRWKLIWTFLPLFLFGALRVDFGNDYYSYEEYFYEFHVSGAFSYNPLSHAEIGYQFLCYVMPSFRSILVLNSFLLCLSLALFCNRNIPRDYLWLAVLLIFLNVEKNIYGSLVGIRNGFAVTIFLLSFVFIQRRNILLFTCATLLAMSLHSSAVFFLPIAYLVGYNREITIKEIVLWITGIIIILMTSVSGMMDFIEPFLVDSYESYNAYLQGNAHRGWLLTATGLLFIYIVLSLFWESRKSLNKEQNALIRLGLFYLLSTLLGSMNMRAGYFYNMFFIGSVCTMMTTTKKSNLLRIALFVLSIVVSIYSFILWRSANYGNPTYDIYHSIVSLF